MWQWIRIPKGLALLAFFLPWMTVSCSSQKLAEATGFGLSFGQISTFGRAAGADHDTLNIWLVLALVVIAAGLLIAFTRGREAASAVLATSVAALVLIVIGLHRYAKEAIIAEAAKGDNSMGAAAGQAALSMIQIDWQIGYWLAVGCLALSAAMAALVMGGKD